MLIESSNLKMSLKRRQKKFGNPDIRASRAYQRVKKERGSYFTYQPHPPHPLNLSIFFKGCHINVTGVRSLRDCPSVFELACRDTDSPGLKSVRIDNMLLMTGFILPYFDLVRMQNLVEKYCPDFITIYNRECFPALFVKTHSVGTLNIYATGKIGLNGVSRFGALVHLCSLISYLVSLYKDTKPQSQGGN